MPGGGFPSERDLRTPRTVRPCIHIITLPTCSRRCHVFCGVERSRLNLDAFTVAQIATEIGDLEKW
jgi:hypothetical protein